MLFFGHALLLCFCLLGRDLAPHGNAVLGAEFPGLSAADKACSFILLEDVPESCGPTGQLVVCQAGPVDSDVRQDGGHAQVLAGAQSKEDLGQHGIPARLLGLADPKWIPPTHLSPTRSPHPRGK